MNAKLPAAGGVTELDAGTESPALIVTLELEIGVPVQALLLKKAYVTPPVTPVEGNPPVNVAWSLTEPPTTIVDGVTTVVMDGLVFRTVRGSQVLLTRVLLVSPPYVALKAKEPAEGGVTEPELGTESPAPTVTVDTELGMPAQAPPAKNA